MPSNRELIPIYTDWANRCLSKLHQSHPERGQFKPIIDLTNEIRDYRLLTSLIRAVEPEDTSGDFTKSLSVVTTNIDGINTCLQYVSSLGVNVSSVAAQDIDSGQLGAVLQLIYALSNYKQQQRQKKKLLQQNTVLPASTVPNSMPPNTKIQSPSRIAPPSQSRLMTPSRLGTVKASPSISPNRLPTTVPSTTSTGLRTPSRILAPRPSGNNNGSTVSSGCSSVASSATYSSIPSTSGIGLSKALQNNSANTTTVPSATTTASSKPKSGLIAPSGSKLQTLNLSSKSSPAKTGLRAPTVVAPVGVQIQTPATQQAVNQSNNQQKMLKLKLFGKDSKDKLKEKSPKASPALSKKSDPVRASVAPPPSTVVGKETGMPKPKSTGMKPPTKISTPKKEIVTIRQRIPPSTQQLTTPDKRTSKSSEEDSAYAGFGSVSPSSASPSSSMSLQSSEGSRESMREHEERGEDRETKKGEKESSQEKPTLAVKGISAPKVSRIVRPEVQSPLRKDSQEPSSVSQSASVSPHKTAQSPTIGVVSPMLNQRKNEVPSMKQHSPVPVDIPTVPSVDNTLEKKRPPVPSRKSSRLETTFDPQSDTVSTSEVPPMAPIRQPPTYEQLITQGRIGGQRSRLGQFVDSSTSEDSLDSVSTTIRCRLPQNPTTHGYVSEGDPERPGPSSEIGYASESGIATYANFQARLREYREMRRRGDYNDSFEDSSSLSSGISENIDDVSTDDLTGSSSLSDHAMAAVTSYGKIGDYGQFVRSNGTKGVRSSSSSIEHRQRRLLEQENIHQLLQQCRTSQRGAAYQQQQQYHTLTGVPHLALSADGDTLSVHSRSSLRVTPKRHERQGPTINQYHSLDRKFHMNELYRDESSPHRLSVYEQRAAMALVSPRRSPHQGPPDSMQRHSLSASSQLSASGMSRSMVLLEGGTPSPRTSRSKRAASPRTTSRLPLSVASPVASPHKGSLSARKANEAVYANCFRDPNLQLHKLTDEVQRSPSHSLVSRDKISPSSDFHGSSLSLASSTAYNSLAEKYENELRKMNRELDNYRHTVSKLTRRQDDYVQMIETFDQKLNYLGKHVEKAQLKPEELCKLRLEIESLKTMSGRVASERKAAVDGAGELLRQPSLESVASHRSSMSSSSKSSKTDKSSLSSFGKTKKSWIRSSFTKAFTRKKNKNGGTSDTEGSPMHHGLNTITGSSSKLDEIEGISAVVELKKQLEDREHALTDIRLDALDSAREVDVLRETVHRLKHENNQLRQQMTRLSSTRSRASSHSSLQLMGEEDPVYETPPNEKTSGRSSKRSSGCNTVKVSVNVDLVGSIRAAICPEHEITIGYMELPGRETTWEQLDTHIYALFEDYINRIDPDRHLGLHCSESVIGYQIGDTVRERMGEAPRMTPNSVITTTTTIRMFLRGATQHSVDSLVLECLFPRKMLDQILKNLLSQRRLVLSGATGIGKSGLARQLAAYLSIRIGLAQDSVVDIKIPDDNNDKALVKIEKQLEAHLRAPSHNVLLLDNIPRHRIAFVSSVFDSVQLENDKGPFIICTVNRACQLPEMQVHHNFKLFQLTNLMEGVKGFMGRYLRRRIIESEFRLSRPTSTELLRIVAFLPTVLQAVNTFIEKANSLDVTVGPRIFLQCPLDVEESRTWFVRLWNQNIIPYMVKVAREGVKVLGRCGSFEDPTDAVCEHWPWMNGPTGEELLQRLSIKDTIQQPTQKQPFNPLDTLIRLQASRNPVLQENM